MAYRLAKAYATVHAVAFAVHKSRVNFVNPNGMTVGDPFAIGLKPEWWHSQWLIVPTTTPAGKNILLLLFLEQGFFTTQITRFELACVYHDPKASEEARAYGVELEPVGPTVKNIPPELLMGDQPIDLKRWLPGNFDK
jgi:hypothetical protein